MDVAQQRIEKCIENNETVLLLNGLGLVSLPSSLPPSIQTLYCSRNHIKELPSNLPASLQRLDCSRNQIRFLPSNLPASLRVLHCSNNPYIHITKGQAVKYSLEETPNFNEKATKIQKRWRLMKRQKL